MHATPQSSNDRLRELCSERLSPRRLILASNRGPIEYHLNQGGQLEAHRGSGGIVTALSSLSKHVELDWITSAMGEGDREAARRAQGERFKVPLADENLHLRFVVTPRKIYHKYYSIICNPLLWFLQHYMWNPPYNPNVDASVHDAWHGGYVTVNQAFARAIVEEAREYGQAPIVIGHDYHLYLLPEYVREEIPDAIIHHFIHIPWPASRYWQMIPSYITNQICGSLCAADLVGFQTSLDRRSFLDSIEEFIPEAEVDHKAGVIEWRGHQTQVKVYPISINVAEVQRIANSPRALDYEARLAPMCNDITIMRIDRAEPNKNIIRGFKAYELLLKRHPDLQGKVSFLAFLVPSRTHIRQYQRYMDEIQQVVGQINSAHATEEWQPIVTFIENNYTQAIAGMKLYDALLVNTIIEGMNLVAKEGPVVNGRDGVLVLSETSGVHYQLKDAALSVSPTDIEGTMEALYQAISMSSEDRMHRASLLVSSVCREDITHWIVSQLRDIAKLL